MLSQFFIFDNMRIFVYYLSTSDVKLLPRHCEAVATAVAIQDSRVSLWIASLRLAMTKRENFKLVSSY